MADNSGIMRPNFFVSSALKDLIGRELVSNKYMAVFELVKNSYDADAKEAHIVFEHSRPDPGEVAQILIYDDGKGMTQDEILKKWLFIGYSDKKDADRNASRLASGRKGIGRFSCDRLGAKLDMYTKTNGDSDWMHLSVDWGEFEKNQQEKLEEVKLSLIPEEVPHVVMRYDPRSRNGTFLLITNPRDSWPYEDLFALRKYLQRMVNPFEPIADFRLFLAAPAYPAEDRKNIKLNSEREKTGDDEAYEKWTQRGPVNGEIQNSVIEAVRERSSWVHGLVVDGKIKIELNEGSNLLIATTEASEFAILGLPGKAEKVEAEVFFMNRNAKNTFTRIMGVRPVDFGSIHVYRNAFRVMPYGEAGNDWLQLDIRRSQGWRRFLSTRDIMGRVSIADRTGTFSEVASREGFYEGKPLTELKNFLTGYIIKRLERYVVQAIDWNTEKVPVDDAERKVEMVKLVDYIAGDPSKFISIGVGPNLLDAVRENEIQKVPELVESLEALAGQIPVREQKEYLEKNLRSLKRGVRELNMNLKQREKEIMFLEKSTELRGPVSDMVNHEVVIAGDDVIPSLEKVIEGLSPIAGMQPFVESLHAARISVQKMIKVAEIALSAKFDLSTEIIEENIVSYIVQYLTKYKKDFLDSKGVTVSFIGEEARLTKGILYLDIAIVIDNLVSNSVKAGCRNILIKFSVEDRSLRMLYSDDGDGVSEKATDLLFVPGMSTRGGKGLGLYTMKRVLKEMSGSITFAGNGATGCLKGACFEVTL